MRSGRCTELGAGTQLPLKRFLSPAWASLKTAPHMIDQQEESYMRERSRSLSLGLSAVLVSMPALAQAPAGRPESWHMGWDWGWGHMIFGPLTMLVFWGGLIVLIVVAARWLGAGSSPSGQAPGPSQKTALGILEERFARGEIDKDEFEERKRLLSD
jgi:putative membrane protein